MLGLIDALSRRGERGHKIFVRSRRRRSRGAGGTSFVCQSGPVVHPIYGVEDCRGASGYRKAGGMTSRDWEKKSQVVFFVVIV